MAVNLDMAREWVVVNQPIYQQDVRLANGPSVRVVMLAPYCSAYLDEEAGGDATDQYVIFGDPQQVLPNIGSTVFRVYEAARTTGDPIEDNRDNYDNVSLDGTTAKHYVGPVHWGHPSVSETHWKAKASDDSPGLAE